MAKGVSKSGALLQRRVRRQQMRVAALRALKSVSALPDERVALEFESESGILDDAAASLRAAAVRAGPSSRLPSEHSMPRLNVVIMVVGSRGDVQPFIPIGRASPGDTASGSRRTRSSVRLSRGRVSSSYPLAGDPHELMDYMVRTGGRIVPTHLDQIVEDVPRKRQIVGDILQSTWRACTENDPGSRRTLAVRCRRDHRQPAQLRAHPLRRGVDVPLHMIFTMPWTPTSAFPHPLAASRAGRPSSRQELALVRDHGPAHVGRRRAT